MEQNHFPMLHIPSRGTLSPNAPWLAEHEHVLRRESADCGAEYVATNLAFYRRNPSRDEHAWQRTEWVEVARTGWDKRAHVLVLHRWPHLPGPDLLYPVRPHSHLPELAADRVGACRVVDRFEELADGSRVEVVALRNPADGTVRWLTEVSGDCDAADPRVASAIDATVHALRVQTGC